MGRRPPALWLCIPGLGRRYAGVADIPQRLRIEICQNTSTDAGTGWKLICTPDRLVCEASIIYSSDSAQNVCQILSIYFHIPFLNEISIERNDNLVRFRLICLSTNTEVSRLAQTIAYYIGRFLELQGLLECHAENSYLTREGMEIGLIDQLWVPRSSFVCSRPAVGLQSVHPADADVLR